MAIELDTSGKFDPFVDEHEALHESLRKLRWVLDECKSPREAAQLLAEFSDHARAHFVHEEQPDGFFDSVVDQAPRLKTRADALIQEHSVMSTKLVELAELASDCTDSDEWWSAFRDGFESFWQSFCQHERLENDLVQEAFHDDIGSKD